MMVIAMGIVIAVETGAGTGAGQTAFENNLTWFRFALRM